MWRRAVVRCASQALQSSRAASRSLPSPALRRASFSLSPLLRASSAAFPPCRHHRHSRCFATQSDDNDSDNDAPASPATSSSESAAESAADYSGAPGVESPGDKFVMVYTCSVCETRSAKTISKHAYYKGVVLVRCPGCENLHLVADRLGWFEDDSTDVESLLQQKGEKVRFVTGDNVLELTENDILGSNKSEQ
ncbi:DNL-type zinc finger protein [Phytophthora cinnamomi]|uniref:DNL-type zinc finger protein n=1 Tax=Phytophthora cinnamomi TaxID=4785 RepID=UPI00355A7751|nr:DNL-type zinc finger protein [Phytophthora cinnamomi]